ncbi:unnamed protein product, partial [Linum tenue]
MISDNGSKHALLNTCALDTMTLVVPPSPLLISSGPKSPWYK